MFTTEASAPVYLMYTPGRHQQNSCAAHEYDVRTFSSDWPQQPWSCKYLARYLGKLTNRPFPRQAFLFCCGFYAFRGCIVDLFTQASLYQLLGISHRPRLDLMRSQFVPSRLSPSHSSPHSSHRHRLLGTRTMAGYSMV
jgi:hypothetical protein